MTKRLALHATSTLVCLGAVLLAGGCNGNQPATQPATPAGATQRTSNGEPRSGSREEQTGRRDAFPNDSGDSTDKAERRTEKRERRAERREEARADTDGSAALPGAPSVSASERSAGAPASASPAGGQAYDYYILNLSWSPEFCATHPGNEQCPSHPGFVVHGLWPERLDGSYPEHCAGQSAAIPDALWTGVIPTSYLAHHEWETHGVCTPYDPAAFFGMVRKAYASIKIPAEFTGTSQETMEPPADIVQAFARINPGFPTGGIVLSCGNNRLTAVELCFDKGLKPMACSGLRTCHANAVKITPQGQ